MTENHSRDLPLASPFPAKSSSALCLERSTLFVRYCVFNSKRLKRFSRCLRFQTQKWRRRLSRKQGKTEVRASYVEKLGFRNAESVEATQEGERESVDLYDHKGRFVAVCRR